MPTAGGAPFNFTLPDTTDLADLVTNYLRTSLVTINSSAMHLSAAQTVTGAKTFDAGKLLDKGSQVFNVKGYGAVGDGATDDTTAIQAAIAAAGAALGIVFFPPGTYKVTASLALQASVVMLGAGITTTVLSFNVAGYCFDWNAATGSNDMGVVGMKIVCGSTATGGIRIGRTTDAYNGNAFRDRTILRDLLLTGAGAATAGKVGMSLTQLDQSVLENVSISSFETGLIFDRCTVNVGRRVRIDTFGATYGLQTIKNDAPSSVQDNWFYGLDVLGPNAGATGIPVQLDDTTHILGGHIEWGVGALALTCPALLKLTANASYCRIQSDIVWDGNNTLTNTIASVTGNQKNVFDCYALGGSYPAATIAAPAAGTDTRHVLGDGCNENFRRLFDVAYTASYVRIDGRYADITLVANQNGAPVAFTLNYSRMTVIGNMAHLRFQMTATAGATGAGQITLTGIPAAWSPVNTGALASLGTLLYSVLGGTHYDLMATATAASTISMFSSGATNYYGAAPPYAIQIGDVISGQLAWECA